MKVAITLSGDITIDDSRPFLVNGEVPDAIFITGGLSVPKGVCFILESEIHLGGDWRGE